ncbi:MAG: type II toxin-antitoxin system HicA family toxin [Acidobacteria bacterium]|nr:type II toxin-antitoxin system HicA family toxin [Acidobacteriota bacterium]
MKIPRDLSGADIVKALQRLGVTVPMHHVVAVGTLQSILRQAEVFLPDLLSAL